jgi:hypothetical protein
MFEYPDYAPRHRSPQPQAGCEGDKAGDANEDGG